MPLLCKHCYRHILYRSQNLPALFEGNLRGPFNGSACKYENDHVVVSVSAGKMKYVKKMRTKGKKINEGEKKGEELQQKCKGRNLKEKAMEN